MKKLCLFSFLIAAIAAIVLAASGAAVHIVKVGALGSETASNAFTKINSNALTFSNLTANLRPVYYVDSVSGNDTNIGSASAPFKTFSKLTNVAGASLNGVEIRLARGSHFREQLTLGTNNLVSAFGSGPTPIISACDVVTNWVKTGGWTNTYSVTNYTFTGGGTPSYVSVAENGFQLFRSNTLAAVDATPGTFFAIDNAPAGSTTNIVYIHPRTSGSPTTNATYEVSKRDYALYGTDNNTVEDLVTRGPQFSNNGSIELHKNSLLRRVVALNGTKHNVFVASGYLEDCSAGLQEYAGTNSATLFVHFDNSDGLSIKYVRCIAFGTPELPAQATGFYGHTLADGYSRVTFEDCGVEYAQSWGSPGIGTNGIAILNRPWGRGLILGGWSFYAGTNVILEPSLFYTPAISTSPSFQAIGINGSRSYNFIAGAAISGAPYSISTASYLTNARIELHQNYLKGAGNGLLVNGTNNTIISSNNIFAGFVTAFQIVTNNTLSASGSNVVQSGGFIVNGVTYATWGAFTAAYPSLEVGSVTNDLQAVGDADNGDFRYASTSPAVTNLAGPGWATVRRPFDLPGIVSYTPQRQVGGYYLQGFANSSTTSLSNQVALKLNIASPQSTGNGTNSAGNFAVWNWFNNGTLIGNRGASSHQNILQFQTGGVNDGWVGYQAGSTSLSVNGASGQPVQIVAGTATLSLRGGGGGLNRIAFVGSDTGATYGLVDPSGFLFWTNGYGFASGKVIANVLYASGSLDFPNVPANGTYDLPITVTGAAEGDIVTLGLPAAVSGNNSTNYMFNAFASNNAVFVRLRIANTGGTAIDPPSLTFKVKVEKLQ